MNTKNNNAHEKITDPDKKITEAHEKEKKLTQKIKDWIADFTEWDGSILNTLIAKVVGHKYYVPFYQRRYPPNQNPIQVSSFIFHSRQELEKYKQEMSYNTTFRFVCYSIFRSPLKIENHNGTLSAPVTDAFKVPYLQ